MAQYGAVAEASKSIWDFDPTSIAGCTLWLDAADRNTTFQDVAGTSPATASTNPVSRWNDKTLLRLPACLNSATGSASQTIVGSTAPVISVDSATGFNTLLFGMGTITITSTVAATGRVNVTSSVTIAAGQFIATFNIGGISLSSPYYVINPTGTPTTSFQLATTPGGSAIALTDSSTPTSAVLASGSLSLPYGPLTLTSASGTTLNITTALSLTLAVGVSLVFGSVTGYSGINTSTTYFITSVNAVNPTTQISISATSGGSAITVSGSGSVSGTLGRNTFTANIADSTFFTVAKGTGPNFLNSTPFSHGSYVGYGVRAIIHSSLTTSGVGNGTGFSSGSITSASMNITCGSFFSNIMSGRTNGKPFTNFNNTDLAPGWLNSGTGTGSASVGSFVPVYPMVGNVGEILYYNRALSVNEIEEIEGYLARKWKIQTLLPTAHAYGSTSVQPFSRQFIPPDIDTCIGWFDAADLSTLFQDTAGTTPVTATSQTIKRWNDKSGQNNFASTTATSGLPSWTTSVNGRPVITANGSTLNSSSISGWNVWGQTYFIVFRTTANYNTFVRPVFTPHGFVGVTNGPTPSFIEWNQQTNVANGPNTLFTIPGTQNNTYIRDVVLVLCVQRSGNLWISSINGGLIGGTQSNTPVGRYPSTGGIALVGTNGTPYDIEEVIIYNSAITSGDRQQVEGYLMWKWGVQRTVLPTLTFTPTHPYYKFPPPSATPSYATSNFFSKMFSPDDLSPVLWFDGTDSNTITSSSNRVTGWRSKGSNTLTLSPPSGFSGPLLTTSGQGSSTGIQFMDFSSGGYFRVTTAVVSTSTTLTLTTSIAHGLTAGAQVAFYFSGAAAGISAPNLTGYYVLNTASGTSLTITIPPSINGTMGTQSAYIRNGDIPILRGDISGNTTLTLRTHVPHGLSNPNTFCLNFFNGSFADGVAADVLALNLNGTFNVGTTPTTSTLTIALSAGTRPTATIGTSTITAANINTATTLRLTSPNMPNIGVGRGARITFGAGTLPSGALQTTLNGFYISQTGTGGGTLVVTIPSQTTGSFTPSSSFIDYASNLITSASVLNTSTAISLIQAAAPTTGYVRFTVASSTNFTVGAIVNITGTTNYNLSNQTIVAVPNTTSFVIQSGLSGASSAGTATLSGESVLITTLANHGLGVNDYFVLSFGSSATLPSGALANTLNGTYRVQSTPTATTLVIVLETPTTTGAVSGLSSTITNTDAVLSRTDGNILHPALGYALESTALSSALNTTFLTAIMTVHHPVSTSTGSYPLRASNFGTGQQSPFIATATTTGENGGNDGNLRDFALRFSSNAGSSGVTPKIGAFGRYRFNSSLGSINSGFSIVTTVINKTSGTIGDVPPLGIGAANQGWRYYSTFARNNIVFQTFPNPIVSIAAVTGTSALITYTPLFSLDTLVGAGNTYRLEGTTGVAPGSYALTAAGTNTVTLTVPSGVVAQGAGGTIADTRVSNTTALSISQLRIGGDTNATNTYTTFPLNGFFYEGGVGDILFFAGTLTMDQRQMVEGFLADKYGIRDQLGGTAGNSTGNFNTNSIVHAFRLNVLGSLGDFSYSRQGLAFWYDAANITTFNGGAALSDGESVTSWAPSGGSLGITLTGGGGGVFPTYQISAQNSLPAIRFPVFNTNAANLYYNASVNLNSVSSNSLYNPEYTIFVAFKTARTPAIFNNIIIDFGAINLAIYDGGIYSNIISEFQASYTPTINTPCFVTLRQSGDRLIIRLNGVQTSSTTTTPLSGTILTSYSRFVIGSRNVVETTSTNAFVGDLYETTMFRYGLTDQAIYQIEGYLAWKWGLQTALPTTHPYYKVRP